MASTSRRWVVFFLVAGFGFALGVEAQRSDPLEAAKRAYLEGSFERSIELLKPLLETLEEPEALRDANFFLGLNYMALRRETDAKGSFESAVRHDPAFLPSDSLYSPELVEAYRSVRDGLVGQLRVDSQPPGARVRLGDRLLGQTPLGADVLAGQLLLQVELEGYAPEERAADIRAGETTTVTLTLTSTTTPEATKTPEQPSGTGVQPPPPSGGGGGGMSGKTIGILAAAGAGAVVVAAASGGGGSSTTPTAPSGTSPGTTPSRASIAVSISPNPITAERSNNPDFPWLIRFEVGVRETAGLGGNVDFINTTLVNAATGTEIPALNFGAGEIISRAGTNHIDGGGNLTVPLGVIYRLSGGERRAILRAMVQFTDDRGNVLTETGQANVQ